MTEEISKSDRAILELAERLEHNEIAEKHRLLGEIKSKFIELQRKIPLTGEVEFVREWISALEIALSTEITLLRAIDNARIHGPTVSKEQLQAELSKAETNEVGSMEVLPKMFAKVTGMGVDKDAEKLKAEIRELIKDYKKGSLKCFRRTKALLDKL